MAKIVNLLGKGQGWDEIESLLDKPKNERGLIYGVNDAFLRTPEVDVSFHMHDVEDYLHDKTGRHSSTKLCIEYANRNPKMEFYTIYRWKRIPHSKEYPLREIVDHFGICYFTSGIEYMIAYALWKNKDLKTLNMFGVNMTESTEYEHQKPGMEYWLGRAQGMGIKVNSQTEYTSLFKTRDDLIYGYFIKQFKPEGV